MSKGFTFRDIPDIVTEADTGADSETGAGARISVATQWQLIWWRFRRHRLAMIGASVIVFLYLLVIFADFLAYSDGNSTEAGRALISPQPIHIMDNGSFHPYIYAMKGQRDPNTFKLIYAPDTSAKLYPALFCRGLRLQLSGRGPDPCSPDWRPGRRYGVKSVPHRNRPPGTRPVVAHDARHTNVSHDRPGGRVDQPLPRSAYGRRLRPLWRDDR